MSVAQKAPDFVSAAVLPDGTITDEFRLLEQIKGKHAILFFYPLDFTFVCPSELIALNNHIEEFKERGVEVIAVSIDSQFTHSAWRNTPVEKGGIGPVKFPLVADIDHTICQRFGVEHPVARVALRGAFLIDKESNVRSAIINDLPLGRSIDELLRLVDALQFHEQHGEVCPANWNKGAKAIKATSEGIAQYLAEEADNL